MPRVQLSINVSDFDAAVAFYSRPSGPLAKLPVLVDRRVSGGVFGGHRRDVHGGRVCIRRCWREAVP